MMIAMVDILAEELAKACREIKKKRGICRHPPMARFVVLRGESNSFRFNGLVCDESKMGGDSTGVGAESCRNCSLLAPSGLIIGRAKHGPLHGRKLLFSKKDFYKAFGRPAAKRRCHRRKG